MSLTERLSAKTSWPWVALWTLCAWIVVAVLLVLASAVAG